MRIRAHEHEHSCPRTRVLITDYLGHKCPKPRAKLGNASGNIPRCLESYLFRRHQLDATLGSLNTRLGLSSLLLGSKGV